MLGVGRPLIGGDGVALRRFFLALVLDGAGGRSQRRQLAAGYQHCRLAGGNIDVVELAVVAAVVALHEGDFGAVGTPLHVLRAAAQNAARFEHFFNGQLLLALSSGRGGLCEEKGRAKRKEDEDSETSFHGNSGESELTAGKVYIRKRGRGWQM